MPLFPLQTVLFPGATLPLRIFEQRYLSMVRDCTRADSGFGVICAWPAAQAGRARHARIGTEAIITDFSTLDDGLLGLRCEGRRRFRIIDTRARDDGLLIGTVDWLPPEPAAAVPARFAALQTLMQELLSHRQTASDIDIDIDDAVELGRCLAALLPLELEHAQALLEMSDPVSRLEALVSLLQDPADEPDDSAH
ncbi:LON peptidase substrate-binding domain-containing protein [Wenzhouxiangella sp. AB-CW3]|nr:LON peptidase substrate-binding domain-containing protein [Wenzhouxiangella sp. AB-CW3]